MACSSALTPSKQLLQNITATQLLHAVYEEKSNLAPTPSRPEQTVAVPKGMFLHLYVINRGHSDGIVWSWKALRMSICIQIFLL